MLSVLDRHRSCAYRLDSSLVPLSLLSEVREVWDEVNELGEAYGIRNSQATVLAPTGTIAFMMDCDTTGVEPDIALVKYKKLVGGGVLKIVNNTVPLALKRLGYDSKQVQEIIEHIDEQETIEGAPHLSDDHLSVFDCAFKPANGTRSIESMGHLRMMGAVQPFLSGAISKTVTCRPTQPSRRSTTPTSRPGASASRRWLSIATAASGRSPLIPRRTRRRLPRLRPR